MAKTKIFVVQLKEIIYTVIFAALGVLLILLLISMFSGKKTPKDTSDNALYKPGVWKSTISLNNTLLDLEVILDKDRVKSVKLVNIDETVTTMNPLLKPSLESISMQLYNGVSIDNLHMTEESYYTQSFLIESIKEILTKAQNQE